MQPLRRLCRQAAQTANQQIGLNISTVISFLFSSEVRYGEWTVLLLLGAYLSNHSPDVNPVGWLVCSALSSGNEKTCVFRSEKFRAISSMHIHATGRRGTHASMELETYYRIYSVSTSTLTISPCLVQRSITKTYFLLDEDNNTNDRWDVIN